MKLTIHRRCSDYRSYRAARVKSLVNVEGGCHFNLDFHQIRLSCSCGAGLLACAGLLVPLRGCAAFVEQASWPARDF